MKILLVDDEASIARLVSRVVEDAGYEFVHAETGYEALFLAEREAPDLIVMDVMMPKMDGFATCRELRARGVSAPVVFLSAKGDIADKGEGFQAGGDDYLTKPFDPRELLMHIEAHLRRSQMAKAPAAAAAPAVSAASAREEVLRVGSLELDVAQHRASKDGKRLTLTPKEFKILRTLAADPGAVFTKEQLVEAAWGREFVNETSSVAVFVRKLREKIEDDPSDPRIIQTVWSVGYRLEPEAC